MRPWPEEPHWADSREDMRIHNRGHTKGDDTSIGLFSWDSYSRVKLDRYNSDPDLAIGYRALTIDIDSDRPDLPGGLADLAVVGVRKIGSVANDWTLSLLAGAGTANDNHYSNSDAIYGIAALHGSHTIDENRSIHAGLHYNGNRTFLPDVPLPYAMYQQRLNPDLSYQAGLPTNSVTWKPLETLTFDLVYTVPVNFVGRLAYDIYRGLSVFAQYDRELDAFYLNDREHHRLFYEIDRVAAGTRWLAKPWIDVRAGVGYAFDQEFSTGFDIRDTDTVAELSDEAFFFFTVQGRF